MTFLAELLIEALWVATHFVVAVGGTLLFLYLMIYVR